MATVKTFLIAASCGMILLGAVSAHAKLSANRLSANGTSLNGINPNALTTTVPSGITLSTNPSEGLSLNGLSQSGLGKPSFEPRTP